MNTDFLKTTSFEDFPKEIQKLIFKNLVGTNTNIFFTKKDAFQKDYYAYLLEETKQKIGLYGKSLILDEMCELKKLKECHSVAKLKLSKIETELVPLEEEYQAILKIRNLKIHLNNLEQHKNLKSYHQSFEINPQWIYVVQNLFDNARCFPDGYSKSNLENLCNFSNSAIDAINQINSIPILRNKQLELENERSKIEAKFSKNHELFEKISSLNDDIDWIHSFEDSESKLISKYRQMKLNEKIIYDMCGGKEKFHVLKVLELNREQKSTWSSYCGTRIDKVTTLDSGQSVMRGLERGRPFLAIKYKKESKIFGNHEGVAVFHQDVPNDPDCWTMSGKKTENFYFYGINIYMSSIKTANLKKLLTTGSSESKKYRHCDVDVETEKYSLLPEK